MDYGRMQSNLIAITIESCLFGIDGSGKFSCIYVEETHLVFYLELNIV